MKKFLFDTVDFDAPVVVDTAPTFSEEQLTLARQQSHAEGQQQGRQQAAAEALEAQEEKIRILLDGIAIALGRLTTAEDRRETEKCIDAARLALHVVHKLMPQLAATHGLPEIERVISSALDARGSEPRIAVTVPSALLDPLRARIDAVAQGRGFANKIIVIADDAMGPSDCRVEWADGGSERIVSRLMMQIENEFAKSIAGMQAATEPDTAAETVETKETGHHEGE